MEPVKLSDYRALAKNKLPTAVFDFIDGGACEEITKHWNRMALDRIGLKPYCLRDVSHLNLSVQTGEFEFPLPILIAPMAFHQLVDPEGETSTAKASASCRVPLIASCMSNRSLEEIALASTGNCLWLQLYIFKDRGLTASLIERAQHAGYTAIVITVGAPISGKRYRDIRNNFSLPADVSTGNFISNIHHEVLYHFTAQQFDDTLTWKDIEWLQSITRLPIILKGILNPMDAEEACKLNVSGIVVSNHGGRQLDTSEAAINALPSIVKTVNKRAIVLVDGSIEHGTDVLKAIALGADAVLIGRPVLWALAVKGERGLIHMLNLLINELEIAMKLSGCDSIKAIQQFNPCLSYVNL